jgi:pilus assembly protein CpaD
MQNQALRIAALAAVLLAGSCAAPTNEEKIFADPAANHPITVAPSHQSVRISYSDSGSGLMPDDAAQLDAFVQEYLARGNGSISVVVPEGPGSQAEIAYFGERLADLGVPRSRILVGSEPVNDGDRRVEVSYVGYVAHTDACGDWSENVAETDMNLPMPNFGCAVQHNVAAMVANPRDLEAPRSLDSQDATRRTTVMGHYEKGEITQADKHKVDKVNEQSGSDSDVGK